MELMRELWKYLRVRKRYWLLPLLLILGALGVLIFLAESSAVAPFVYTLF